MTEPPFGFASRRSRLISDHSGTWASSSQDFVRLARLLYQRSVAYARQTDGNCSVFALAGIPMLFSALHAFLVELYSGVFGGEHDHTMLRQLISSPNDVAFIREQHAIDEALLTDLTLLQEIRNEIIHPAHRPGPEADGTPEYLRPLKSRGLLQSTGGESDFVWIGQLQSHRLFRWSFATIAEVVVALLDRSSISPIARDALTASYLAFRSHDDV